MMMMNAEINPTGKEQSPSDLNGEVQSSVEQDIMKKKQEKFQTEIRNSKKKSILNTNRVRIFQKYILEVTPDAPTVKQLIPEHIYTNPSHLKVYVEQLIDGFKRDFDNFIPSNSNNTTNPKTDEQTNMLPKSLNHLRLLSSLKSSFSVVNQIVESDIHSMLLHLMSELNERTIRIDAGWLLNNLLTVESELVSRIVNHNYQTILASFSSMYSAPDEDLDFSELGAWGITNLCVDKQEAAQLFYEQIGFGRFEEKYMLCLKNRQNLDTLAWMLSVFSQSQKMLNMEDKQMFLRLAEQEVLDLVNPDMQFYGVRILYYISSDEHLCIALAKRTTLIDRLLMIANQSQELVSYCIGIVGNLLSFTSEISKILLERNILEHLSIALDSARQDVRREALWCISNLLSGDEEEIQCVIDFTRLIEKMFQIARVDSIQNVFEVSVGMSNCLSSATKFQISKLISLGILEVYVKLLLIQDVNIILKTLQGIAFLLDYGENVRQFDQMNPVKFTLQSLGFNQILLSMQYHPYDSVQSLADEITDSHFQSECLDRTIPREDLSD